MLCAGGIENCNGTIDIRAPIFPAGILDEAANPNDFPCVANALTGGNDDAGEGSCAAEWEVSKNPDDEGRLDD